MAYLPAFNEWLFYENKAISCVYLLKKKTEPCPNSLIRRVCVESVECTLSSKRYRMKTILTREQVRQRLMRYCDKAERCQQDVLNQAIKLGLSFVDGRELLSQLIVDGFVSEQRYASAFAHDKFTFNRWGARKIELALRQKGVSEPNIRAALKQIPKEDESEALLELIKRKSRNSKGCSSIKRSQRYFVSSCPRALIQSPLNRLGKGMLAIEYSFVLGDLHVQSVIGKHERRNGEQKA